MIANGDQNDDGSRPTRASSLWIWLAMACFLAVGIKQVLHPAAKTNEAASLKQNIHMASPSESGFATANINHHHQAAGVGADNPLVDHLEKLIQSLQSENDPMKREALIAGFLAGMKTHDIFAVLDLLKAAQPADLAVDLSQRLVRRWAGSDPQDVAAWINNLPTSQQRQAALGNLAIVWANSQL